MLQQPRLLDRASAHTSHLGEPDSFAFRSAHGMRAAQSKLRTFGGIAVRHLQHFNNPGRAWHDLSGPQDTLTIVLAETGGACQARTGLHRPPALARQRPNHISFIPAEMRTWGYTDHIDSVRELRLSFDKKSLAELLGPELDLNRAATPELMFHDHRVLACARLLAAECDSIDPVGGLYGDGLTTALLSACFLRASESSSGLSALQLRRVLDFLHEHLHTSISLAELARLAGLSSSQFSRQFKASTGQSPHQYHLQARITRAQHLLLTGTASLSVVALATGFVDQSHFTRVFKRVTGVTPHAWRQDRTS